MTDRNKDDIHNENRNVLSEKKNKKFMIAKSKK